MYIQFTLYTWRLRLPISPSHSLPVKDDGMAGQDVKENEMQQVSVAALLRCLDAAGNSKVITPTYLLKDAVIDRGSFDYANRDLLDDMITPGMYNHGNSIVGTNGGYGLLLVLKSYKYIVQLDFVTSGKIIFRFSPSEGTSWTSWKYLTFT